jgi:hypothetical protein
MIPLLALIIEWNPKTPSDYLLKYKNFGGIIRPRKYANLQ